MTASASNYPDSRVVQPTEPRRIPSGGTVEGSITPPSSKSFTHRYLNLAWLAGGGLELRRPLLAEDTRLFLRALTDSGYRLEEDLPSIHLAPGGPAPAAARVYCGNAGTMFRFLTASLAALPGSWTLDGSERLRERPVGPLLAALRQLGADISCPVREGHAPLEIRGGSLLGGRAQLDAGESSQYLSALLMAGQRAEKPIGIRVSALTSAPYLDLTLQAIEAFGGSVRRPTEDLFELAPGRLRNPGAVSVEGDFSAACYAAAAAALAGGEVRIHGMRSASAQGDRQFLDLLQGMGAPVAWREEAGEEVLRVGAGELRGITADLSRMPDQVPTLAALAPFARGVTRIERVEHLRIKESDRLHAMATGLRRLGVPAEELPGGLVIPGVWAEGVAEDLPEVEVETHDDHRIAMSFALVGLRRPGVVVKDPQVVAKSYPSFWRDLEGLLAR